MRTRVCTSVCTRTCSASTRRGAISETTGLVRKESSSVRLDDDEGEKKASRSFPTFVFGLALLQTESVGISRAIGYVLTVAFHWKLQSTDIASEKRTLLSNCAFPWSQAYPHHVPVPRAVPYASRHSRPLRAPGAPVAPPSLPTPVGPGISFTN